MNLKKEEKKNLNYIIQQNKDFSFRNDKENDENESLNLALISNSSSKKQVQNNIELSQSKKKIKGKTENIDLLNQLIVNRLIQENKFIKQELEIAKSNILILEEKESQYKSTIEHINKINKEKEISYKNIMSLINSYKKRESELNQKISLYSKEIIKKNEIINKLNQKINIINEQMSKLNNILTEKMKIINILSRNRKNRFNSYDLNLNESSNNTISKSVNIINHNRKESDAKLHYREKTLSNMNSKFDDFNNIDNIYINKKYSNERLNTLNNLNIYDEFNLNNNTNNKFISDIDSFNNNTEALKHVTKLVRKKSGYKKLINNKNNNIIKNIPNTQTLRKINSYKNVGYNSVNSTINKNQNYINNSLNLIQYKKVGNKIYQHLNKNQSKKDLKKMIMISPSNRFKNTNSFNINNNLTDFNNNYSSIVNKDDKYIVKNDDNKNNIYKNKKGIKFNKNLLINKIMRNNTNENVNPNKIIKNENKHSKKIEINKYFINNTDNTCLSLNPSFRNNITERNNFFK